MINQLLTQQTFANLFQHLENKYCFECGSPQPNWTSLSNAIFLCLACSGQHRSLGVSVSQIRSISLDQWNEKQLQMMMLGGNQRLKDFFQSIGVYSEKNMQKEWSWKWRIKAAQFYRDTLKAQVEEKSLPLQPNEEELLEEDPNIQIPLIFSKSQQKNPSLLNDDDAGSQQNQDFQTYSHIIQQQEPIDRWRTVFLLGFTKIAEVANKTKQKIDNKINDPQFQREVQDFKEKVTVKSSEMKEKSTKIAKDSYEILKENASSAWGFLKQQYEEKVEKKNVENNVIDQNTLLQSEEIYTFQQVENKENNFIKGDDNKE